MRRFEPIDRKVTAATAGSAVGALVEAALVGALGQDWVPPVVLPTLGAFAFGYLRPPERASSGSDGS